jgi:hypothetical protein
MKSLFGRIHLGRLPDEQQRHKQLLRALRKIMATQNEIVAELATANNALKDANQVIADTKAIIVKVGTETDKLKEQIANLPPTEGATPELVAALGEIKATIAATAALVAEAKTEAGVVDDKVAD